MTTTTILNDDSATIVSDEPATKHFNWSAAFAGALLATAVNFFLITLGSGVGLAVVSAPGANSPTFLTLGAIYFLAAQAFGFAAGGHLAGRLIGPAVETDKEEEFRACAHGMLVWALGVVATATMISISALVAGSAATHGALIASATQNSSSPNSEVTGYWVDMLFRPANETHASLNGIRFAQIAPNNDASPAPEGASPPRSEPSPPASTSQIMPSGVSMEPRVITTPMPIVNDAQSIAAEKSEAGRILARDMAKGGDSLSTDDRNHLAQLVSTGTGMPFSQAAARVNDVQGEIRDEIRQAAEVARKTISYTSVWMALALLFGGIVTVLATLFARWHDDKVIARTAPV